MATERFHLDSVMPARATRAPVLCLHGLHAGSWAFEEFLPRIAARGHPAYAVSYRGHAPNPALPDIGRQSLSDFVDDAAAAVRTMGRPIVIGHSMGGLIAQLLAKRDLVRAVVLVSSAPPRGIPAITPTLLARMPRYLLSMLFSRPFMMTDRDIDELALNKIPVSTRAEMRRRFTPDSGRAVRQMAVGVFGVPRGAIQVPLLVLGADEDRFIPLTVAERLSRRHAAPLHVARGHGHMLFGEDGWETQGDAILDWIGALPEANPEPAGRIHFSSSATSHSSTQGMT